MLCPLSAQSARVGVRSFCQVSECPSHVGSSWAILVLLSSKTWRLGRRKGFVLVGSFLEPFCLTLRFKAEDWVSGGCQVKCCYIWPLELAGLKLALG